MAAQLHLFHFITLSPPTDIFPPHDLHGPEGDDEIRRAV
jgi:hypothetical protein